MEHPNKFKRELIRIQPTLDSLHNEHALVLHISDELVGDEHVYALRSEYRDRVQSLVRQIQGTQKFARERAAGETLEVDGSPNATAASTVTSFYGEVEAELRLGRLGMQRIEKPDTVGKAADLDKIIA